MAKRKLTVVTEFGTFSRQTDRQYQFVIISRGLHAHVVERRHRDAIAYALDSIQFYEKELAKPGDAHFSYSTTHDGVKLTGRQTAELALAQYRESVQNDARDLASKLASAAAEGFGASSWSSRFDLARKAAADAAEYNMDVRIIDVATGKEVRF